MIMRQHTATVLLLDFFRLRLEGGFGMCHNGPFARSGSAAQCSGVEVVGRSIAVEKA